MPYTKIYFKTKHSKTGKIGTITAFIFENKCMIRFDNHQQAEMTYKKLLAQGNKALFERGVVIQFFKDMTQQQILDLIKKDIEMTAPSVGVDILDYKEERIE